MRKLDLILALAMVFAVVVPPPAHAYLDPGTGSAIVTAVLGFFAAVAFTVRKYYYKIVSVFRRKDESSDEHHP